MKRLSQLALLSTGLVFALFACRGGGDDSSGDDMMMPDGPQGGMKVKDVQNDSMPSGTAVELRGVIVTAIDGFGARTGDIWVQDAEGGPFSGIKVFGAPPDQLLALTVGDIVDITNAEKDEFKYMSGTSMDEGSVTELKGAAGGMLTITKKGAGSVPAPAEVDAKAIAAMSKDARVAEWEKWEGVLIKVTGARQLADTTSFGANMDQSEFRISGIARVQSAMVELPAAGMFGVCYASITGVGDHFFNDLVLPRTAADLVVGGTGCNPMATTITQARTTPNTELAEVTDVFVSAVSFNKKNLWLTTSLTAAPNEGVYVFRGTGSSTPNLPTDVVVGAKVTVRGAVVEFNQDATGDTQTQITAPTITVTAAPAAPPVAVVGQSASALVVKATGEPYESVLVTLTDVKVNTVGDMNNFFVGELQQGATKFLSDDDVLRLLPGDVGKCYTMTGVWTYSGFDDKYGLLPITKVETPAGCQ